MQQPTVHQRCLLVTEKTRRHVSAAAASDLENRGSEADVDEDEFDFDDDEEGDTDAYPGLLADSVASEIANADVPSDGAADDSDWTDGLWGGDETRPESKADDEWEEAVLNVARVTKVVKGGRQMGFRADVVVGDKKGTVGTRRAALSIVSPQ